MPVKTSNANKTRNLRRLITFLQTKIGKPPLKTLDLSRPTVISILPTIRPLSISNPFLTDLPPEIHESHLPYTPRPNHKSKPLIMNLSVNRKPSDIPIRNGSLLTGMIPQLDGGTPDIDLRQLEPISPSKDSSNTRSMLGLQENL